MPAHPTEKSDEVVVSAAPTMESVVPSGMTQEELMLSRKIHSYVTERYQYLPPHEPARAGQENKDAICMEPRRQVKLCANAGSDAEVTMQPALRDMLCDLAALHPSIGKDTQLITLLIRHMIRTPMEYI